MTSVIFQYTTSAIPWNPYPGAKQMPRPPMVGITARQPGLWAEEGFTLPCRHSGFWKHGVLAVLSVDALRGSIVRQQQ